MSTLEWISLSLIPGFLLLDLLWRKRNFEATAYWRIRALAVTVAIFLFSGEVAFFWSKLLSGYHLLDLSHLGVWLGALLGILVYELIHYWYHRKAHAWNWLWFAGHQFHHSAESLDAYGAYYLHPFDAFMFTTISSLVFFPLLGLPLESGIIAALFLTFNALFQHANIATPHWLGYIIQRPESHFIHHGRRIHRFNYSDLPLWDMVFGTFRNPSPMQLPSRCGFYSGASTRILDMLVGRDVAKALANNNQHG